MLVTARVIVTSTTIPLPKKRWSVCRKHFAVENILKLIRNRPLRMSTQKTDKELAFLHDLFIAPDWGERFAELIDQHVTIPKKGKVLYVAVGTGGHAIALHERAGK